MPTITIDIENHPNLRFRIDNFSVPAAPREEFEATMHRNVAFLETLPGFLGHVAFEKTSGTSTFNIVTVAARESREALERAVDKVRAYFQSIGFDMPTMLARWGVTAERADYHAPRSLQ